MSEKRVKDMTWYEENGWEIVEENLDFENGDPENTIKMLKELMGASKFEVFEIMVEPVDYEFTYRILWGRMQDQQCPKCGAKI